MDNISKGRKKSFKDSTMYSFYVNNTGIFWLIVTIGLALVTVTLMFTVILPIREQMQTDAMRNSSGYLEGKTTQIDTYYQNYLEADTDAQKTFFFERIKREVKYLDKDDVPDYIKELLEEKE